MNTTSNLPAIMAGKKEHGATQRADSNFRRADYWFRLAVHLRATHLFANSAMDPNSSEPENVDPRAAAELVYEYFRFLLPAGQIYKFLLELKSIMEKNDEVPLRRS